jgi:uncharacterized protein (DUF2147 family)
MMSQFIRGFAIAIITMQSAYAVDHSSTLGSWINQAGNGVIEINIDQSSILGNWINQAGDGVIEISIDQNEYFGTIIGSANPERSDRKDINNPDPKLRDRPLEGIRLLNGLSYKKENLWDGGTLYDPNNGKTYDCKVTFNDDGTLNIRGYAGISFFGRTEVWKRQK